MQGGVCVCVCVCVCVWGGGGGGGGDMSETSLGPRPKPATPDGSLPVSHVTLEAIRAGVGLGLGPRLE